MYLVLQGTVYLSLLLPSSFYALMSVSITYKELFCEDMVALKSGVQIKLQKAGETVLSNVNYGQHQTTIQSSAQPLFNEPLYNEVLGMTNVILRPSNSKISGKEPRYNETSPV